GRDDRRFEIRSGLRLYGREALFVAGAQAIGQGAPALAGSPFRRIGQQRLEPVVRKRVDDVLLEAPVVPPEQECGELPRKRASSRRMLSLFVVSKSAESQAAGGQGLEKAQGAFMAPTVGHMDPVVLK